jgi:hypothetical protein
MNRKAFLLGVLAMFVAAQAGATVMETWSQTSLQFTNLGRAQATATATGLTTVTTSSTSSSHLSTLSLAYQPGLSLNSTIPVTDPTAAPITSVILTSVRGRPDLPGREGAGNRIGNISGAIASSGGGLSNAGVLSPGTIPTTGGVTICLLLAPLPPCVGQLNLLVGATSAGLQIGGGVGGILTIGGTGTIRISVVGAPWTVKTVSAVNRTANGGFDLFAENGFAHGPLSSTSSTAQQSGVLQIVTANHTTVVGPGDNDISGQISRLLVHFIPEPGLLLLFGSGAVGMVLLGRKRIRK